MSIFVTVVRCGAGERAGGREVQKQNGTADEKTKSTSPSQTPLIAKHNHGDKRLASLLLKNTRQKKVQESAHKIEKKTKQTDIFKREYKYNYICIHHKEYITAVLLSIFTMTVHCVAVHN